MADPTQINWGDPGQAASPLAAALAALGADPNNPVGRGNVGTAGTEFANIGRTDWGMDGTNSPLQAAMYARGLNPNINYAVSNPTTGLAGTEFANLGFQPGAAGNGPLANDGTGGLGGLGGTPGGPPPIPKDPMQEIATWKAFRDKAGQATQGINNMPFVFGGANTGGYDTLSGMTPDQIFAKFYKGGTPPSQQTSSPIPSPTASQSSLLQAGGLPALLLGNAGLQPSQQQSNGLFGWGFLGL